MKVLLRDIYWEFLLIGIQLLGGGYVIVPLISGRIIEKRKWITSEDLTNFYALSQSIPGIIAANISAFVGYKLRNKRGAAVALLGIMTSPIIAILCIATIVDCLLNISFIQSIFWGVGISVIVLIYLNLKEMWENSIVDIVSWIIFLMCFTFSFFFKISPVMLILTSILIGVSYKFFKEKYQK